MLLLVGSFSYEQRVTPSVEVFSLDAASHLNFHLRREAKNPSFFWQHPRLPLFYVVNETGGPDATFQIFSFCDKGSLREVASIPSGGGSPCHLDGTEKWLAVANYNGGTVRFFPLGEDGLPGEPFTFEHNGSGPHPKRQTRSHPHGVHFSPHGVIVAVPDLGTDEVLFYRVGKSDAGPVRVSSFVCPPGSGPRHACFHPNKPLLFVIAELSNELLVIELDKDGVGSSLLTRTSSLPPGFDRASTAAEILLHPSGTFLVGSNRGAETLAIWPLDDSGMPSEAVHFPLEGNAPRSMHFSPDGSILAVGLHASDEVHLFEVDTESPYFRLISQTPINAPIAVHWLKL